MKRVVCFFVALTAMIVTVGCDFGSTQSTAPESESMARYRERYKKSGGFDPVSKSLGQKMK